MIFQAFRANYDFALSFSSSVRLQNSFVLRFPLLCVSCGPCRSSFSAALEDVRTARKKGFVAAVRPLSSTNQL